MLLFFSSKISYCVCFTFLYFIVSATAPLYAENAPTAIDGEYVVILKEDLSEKDGK